MKGKLVLAIKKSLLLLSYCLWGVDKDIEKVVEKKDLMLCTRQR
jgi:hypothetical protein